VTGNTVLDGTLDVQMWNDFTAKAGDEFVIMNFDGDVSGSFDRRRGPVRPEQRRDFDIEQSEPS